MVTAGHRKHNSNQQHKKVKNSQATSRNVKKKNLFTQSFGSTTLVSGTPSFSAVNYKNQRKMLFQRQSTI